MALTPSLVLTPKGRLDARALWPELRTQAAREDRARDYIAAAGLQITQDGWPAGEPRTEAARLHWVYYRAWQERYDKAIDNPTSITLADEGGGHSFTEDQLERMRVRAQGELDAYLALLTEAVGEIPTEPLPGTLSIPTEFSL